MNGQMIVVSLLVGGSALYLALRTWRTWRGRGGCAKGCGCGEKNTETARKLIPVEELTLRVRDAK